MRGEPIGERAERRLALGLAALAAARVLLCALAFPFFANVDEYRHVDMVLKYARGFAPGRERDAYEAETSRLVALLGSPEYHRDPARTSELPPPVWRADPEVLARRIERSEALLGPLRNLDAHQSPAYYALAGAWLRLGRALGLGGGPLLYAVRALAAPAAFALVLAAWALLRRPYPRSRFVRLGVPALLAWLPQDCLYYVTSDALSPLLGGLAFLLLVDRALAPRRGVLAAAGAGLVGAAAMLAKLPNALLLGVAAFCAWASRGAARAAAAPQRRAAWFVLFAALLLPVAAWLARNALLVGAPTGDADKIAALGWGRRPLGEWLAHPLLRPRGMAAFLAGLGKTFWRGELAWHQTTLAHAWADGVYLAASALGLTAAALGLRGERPRDERLAERAAFVALGGALAILVGLSLRFSYGPETNPSLARPWFANGRLVAGALVPFALLVVRGLEVACARLPERARAAAAWSALAALCAVAAISEASLLAPVLRSGYNAFHLPVF